MDTCHPILAEILNCETLSLPLIESLQKSEEEREEFHRLKTLGETMQAQSQMNEVRFQEFEQRLNRLEELLESMVGLSRSLESLQTRISSVEALQAEVRSDLQNLRESQKARYKMLVLYDSIRQIPRRLQDRSLVQVIDGPEILVVSSEGRYGYRVEGPLGLQKYTYIIHPDGDWMTVSFSNAENQ